MVTASLRHADLTVMALSNLKDTLLVNLDTLFENYIIVPFGLLKKGSGRGFERHLSFQLHFSSLISLCKDFFKTCCDDSETLCVHCNKFVVYTCKCEGTPFGSSNRYCFTCLVLHVHCESFFTKLSDANLLYLCDVHVNLIVHLGLFLLLVYGDGDEGV